MDIEVIERAISASGAGVVLADPRLLRRVIKRHRGLPGLGLQVPHATSYALGRDALLALIEPGALGRPTSDLPGDLILLPRPTADELLGKTETDILIHLWRASFHSGLHLELDRRIAAGALDDADVRARIDRIGQTEFDEIRAILRHDDLLLPPHEDRGVYVEFVALYLELLHFAPALVEQMFPDLRETARVEEVVAADVPDPRAILDRYRPPGAPIHPIAPPDPRKHASTTPTFSALPTFAALPMLAPKKPRNVDIPRLVAEADGLCAKGNVVAAALLRAAALPAVTSEQEMRLRAAARSDLELLDGRLAAALRPPRDARRHADTAGVEWTSLLLLLAEEAGPKRGLRFPVEARLLYDLQAACAAGERSIRTVDLVTWGLSLGKRPIVRALPATREVRIARHIRNAAAKLRHVRMPAPDRKLLSRLLRWARERAEQNIRDALGPAITAVLNDVGLRPSSLPEEVARQKLVLELLDQVVDRGFFSIGHLRDALSRNQLKLNDLEGVRELLAGDALLEADRRLATTLDGVYRPGEVYLRGLQKGSSIAFGTRVGRAITLYLALPLGAAFALLEGVSHMVGLVTKKLGLREIDMRTRPALLAMTVVIFALIHSEAFRAFALRATRLAGRALAALFFRLPRWILARPTVRAIFRSRPLRIAVRLTLVPLAVTAAVYYATPLHVVSTLPSLGGATAIFAAISFAINSRVSIILEEVFLDWLVRKWRLLRRRVLPGLVRLIIDVFKALIELLERGLYKVDEWLRFREGEHPITLGLKAAAGFVWFVIAYVIRLYIILLVEPEVNPVKHFPVVTVAHKIVFPFSQEIMGVFQTALSPLGPVIANAIAGPTVALLPSVFGFLMWELKENFRLYRENRPPDLRPTTVGLHGETMGALMKPGLHSGTLPKLYAKLRRAVRRGEGAKTTPLEALKTSRAVDPGAKRSVERSLGRMQEELRAVEEAVQRFVERELGGLLAATPRWPHGPLTVRDVDLGSNRVRIAIVCEALSPVPCEIAFEEQSGLLVASIPKAGFIDLLPDLGLSSGAAPRQELRDRSAKTPAQPAQAPARPNVPHASGEPRLLVENAIAGLYKLAGVDLVREQIEDALGDAPPYDIADEGLVVWPGKGFRTEIIYDLDEDSGASQIHPIVRGAPPSSPPPILDRRQILFRKRRVLWNAWVHAWRPDPAPEAPIPRLIAGASILPRPKLRPL